MDGSFLRLFGRLQNRTRHVGEALSLPKRRSRLGFPRGVAERSESFKIMIAGGNHSKIRKLDFLASGTSEPIA